MGAVLHHAVYFQPSDIFVDSPNGRVYPNPLYTHVLVVPLELERRANAMAKFLERIKGHKAIIVVDKRPKGQKPQKFVLGKSKLGGGDRLG